MDDDNVKSGLKELSWCKWMSPLIFAHTEFVVSLIWSCFQVHVWAVRWAFSWFIICHLILKWYISTPKHCCRQRERLLRHWEVYIRRYGCWFCYKTYLLVFSKTIWSNRPTLPLLFISFSHMFSLPERYLQPSSTRRQTDLGLMTSQLRRWWFNIGPMSPVC